PTRIKHLRFYLRKGNYFTSPKYCTNILRQWGFKEKIKKETKEENLPGKSNKSPGRFSAYNTRKLQAFALFNKRMCTFFLYPYKFTTVLTALSAIVFICSSADMTFSFSKVFWLKTSLSSSSLRVTINLFNC